MRNTIGNDIGHQNSRQYAAEVREITNYVVKHLSAARFEWEHKEGFMIAIISINGKAVMRIAKTLNHTVLQPFVVSVEAKLIAAELNAVYWRCYEVAKWKYSDRWGSESHNFGSL